MPMVMANNMAEMDHTKDNMVVVFRSLQDWKEAQVEIR